MSFCEQQAGGVNLCQQLVETGLEEKQRVVTSLCKQQAGGASLCNQLKQQAVTSLCNQLVGTGFEEKQQAVPCPCKQQGGMSLCEKQAGEASLFK